MNAELRTEYQSSQASDYHSSTHLTGNSLLSQKTDEKQSVDCEHFVLVRQCVLCYNG